MSRNTEMTSEDQYREAENAFLRSEGFAAESVVVDLPRIGSTLRLLVAGEGPPVLLMPGVMTSGAVFAGLVGRLPDVCCIMVDRPGTGLSPLPPAPATDLAGRQRLADDLLVDVLDGLGLADAAVVSTSMGGWTTFRSAAAHPDRFSRICALGYQVGARIDHVPLSMRMPVPFSWMLPRSVPVSRRLLLGMLKTAGMRGAIEGGMFSDEMTDWMRALLRHTETFRNDSLYCARPAGLRGADAAVQHTAELLASVRCPVHLFWGSDDIFGGEGSAQQFRSELTDATLQMVEGAGHAPWLDEPELAAEAVREHLPG